MRRIRLVAALAAVASIASVAACQDAKDPTAAAGTPPPAPAVTAARTAATDPAGASASPKQSVDEASLDASVKPCDDFYRYACGGWIKATPIPDDEALWYRSFNGIQERNEKILRALLEAFAKGERAGEPYAKQLGDFYASCMDEAAVEKAGVGALAAEMAKVESVKDTASLSAALGKLIAATGVPFVVGEGPDYKDSSTVITQMNQGGLGLPDRDYFLSNEAKKKELRGKYTEHVERMLALAGSKSAKADAATVLRIETALAKAAMTREDRREPKKVYHRLTLAEVVKLAPELDWAAYFKEGGIPASTSVNVEQPEFVKAFAKLAKATPAADLRTYLKWHVLHAQASRLPAAFVDEGFRMKSALTGAAKLPPRWKRCVRETDGALGEALGRAFVKETLGEGGKAEVVAMVHSIEAAMRKNLAQLSFMDDATRKRAGDKLDHIANMIAYPDKWRSYDGLTVERGAYLANGARADAFELARELAKVGKPVDRTEWQLTPPTVNAYYEPTMNQMVFPAGILQPPYYAPDRTLAANLGGVGMVMGHELTHGFDDQGRQFDAKGNLEDWWSPKVNDEFLKRASCVEKQYAGYAIPSGEHVNGKLTLGENIADLGGIKLAYEALLADPAPRAPSGKWTPEQQFFLGFAQGWCASMRDEYARLMVTVNPHSPAQFRVDGPVSNMPAFAKAFGCKEGDPMVRSGANRCEVW